MKGTEIEMKLDATATEDLTRELEGQKLVLRPVAQDRPALDTHPQRVSRDSP